MNTTRKMLRRAEAVTHPDPERVKNKPTISLNMEESRESLIISGGGSA